MSYRIEKMSISLPASLVSFVKTYQNTHQCKSQSEVVREALKLLRVRELESYYLAAETEQDSNLDATASDGLDDEETW